MLKKYCLALLLTTTFATASAEEYMYTTTYSNGVEVHIAKMSELRDIMTVVVVYENNTDDEQEVNYKMRDIYFITADAKYPILQDSRRDDLTSLPETTYFNIEPGEKKMYWIKFETPPADAWPIEFIMPGILPIIIDKPEGFSFQYNTPTDELFALKTVSLLPQ